MSASITSPDYSSREETFNVITHGLGLGFAIVGLFLLILRAQGMIAIVSVSVYGSTLILMFLASTIYHSVQNPKGRKILKVLDHSAIYLLIAGTYTPYLLISLDGNTSTIATIIIWLVAVSGVGFKLLAGNRFPKISLATYLLMGWFVIAIIYPLYHAVPAGGLWLLLAGGLFFSLGTLFYAAKHKKYTHAIWHLFVIGGCACHYFSIYLYVV